MFMREWGAENQKTALLIHGLSSSSQTWRQLAKDLERLGYHVYAPDLTGHGHSPKEESYSINKWTQQILDLNLNPQLIIGHSMGGVIASNLVKHLNPETTILLDPALSLPQEKHLISLVQLFYMRFILIKAKIVSILKPRFKISNILNELVLESSRWDTKTTRALTYNAVGIETLLHHENNPVYIYKARGFLVNRTLIKTFSSNSWIKVEKFNSSHNIHQAAYGDFMQHLNQALRTS